MIQVRVTRRFAAPPDRVWTRYTDHASWSRWAGLGPAVVTRPGVPAPNGIGAIRRMGPGPMAVHEEIVAWEPPRRMAYRLVGGSVPIRDHFGEVWLEPDGDGTQLVWRVRCAPLVPGTGWLVRAALRRIFVRALGGLARDLQA